MSQLKYYNTSTAQWETVVVGAIGPTGPTGPTGSMGPTGITFKNAWTSMASYVTGDVVTYAGSSYYCTLAVVSSSSPASDTSHWTILAAAGATGATGPTGYGGSGSAGASVTVTTVTSSSATVVESFAAASYNSCKFSIEISSTTSPYNYYVFGDLLCVHDGTNVTLSMWPPSTSVTAGMSTPWSSLSFSGAISAGSVLLQVTINGASPSYPVYVSVLKQLV